MSQYDDPPTFPGYRAPGYPAPLAPGSWDGTTEALAMGVVMEPPDGFLARAVARGLAVVEAEEALVAYREQRLPANDQPTAGLEPIDPDLDDDEPVTLRPTPRSRHDSGVYPSPVPPDAEQ